MPLLQQSESNHAVADASAAYRATISKASRTLPGRSSARVYVRDNSDALLAGSRPDARNSTEGTASYTYSIQPYPIQPLGQDCFQGGNKGIDMALRCTFAH